MTINVPIVSTTTLYIFLHLTLIKTDKMGGIRFKSLGHFPSTLSEISRSRLFQNRCTSKATGVEVQNKRCLSNTKKVEAMRWVMQNQKPYNPTGYFITLPNVPDESAENNSFLESIEHNAKWPPLQSASPDEFYEGTVKLILDYGASVWEQLDLLDQDANRAAKGASGELKRTFDNTVSSLLDEEYDVYYAQHTLLVKMFTDWPQCHSALFQEDLYQVQNTFKREMAERWTEPTWVEAVKKAYENDAGKLKPWQQRYLEWMILQARLCGYLTVKTNDKKAEKQQEINYSWNSSTNLFGFRFLYCIMQDNGVSMPIEHRYLLKNAPPRALALLSKRNDPVKGPWEATSTKYDTLFSALNYCSAREIRQALWDSYVTRAAFRAQRPDLNNSQNIEELRHNNDGFAKALGFSSTAHHRISSKMAGSPQTVRVFVDELTRRLRPVFFDRLEGAWKVYAEEQEERIISDLQAFDLFYICRREAEHYFNVDTLALMKHFPVSSTFEKVLQLSAELFNITFKDVTADYAHNGFERCDPSVRLFDVTDNATDERIGFLYIDIFSRPTKKLARGHWISLLGRPANQLRGLDTLVYVLGCHPQEGSDCLLHHEELSEMLSAFGRALQLLFSRSPCHFLSLPMAPYYASDFDANNFMPSFMQFCMYKPQFLELLSSPNVETGKPLHIGRATNYSKALQRATFWESYRILFWTDFDLTVHNMHDWKKKFWLDLYKQMYSEYFPTFQGQNYQPTSFTSTFGLSSWSGLFYRKLWAEMLALDVHRTFETEGNTKVTADRLKTEWLNHGAMELQSELFRKFQGREPNMGGICDFYDSEPIVEKGSEKIEQGKTQR